MTDGDESRTNWIYAGPPEIHDAAMMSVEDSGDQVVVQLKSLVGRFFSLTFFGVTERQMNRPVGMGLYSLSTTQAGSLTRYSLTNWDEEDDAFCEIIGEGFHVSGDIG